MVGPIKEWTGGEAFGIYQFCFMVDTTQEMRLNGVKYHAEKDI